MATILSVTEIIQLGRATTYLSANYVSQGALFGARIIKPNLPVQIAFVTDALDWGNNSGAETAASLRSTASYAYWLYGRFQLEAQRIINGAGGGSVVPTPNGYRAVPNPYDWQVGATTSDTEPLADGDATATLTRFIGYNLEFTRGNLTQNTTNVGDGTSYYSWNRETGVFVVSPAASLGELFRIVPTTGNTIIQNSPTNPVTYTSGTLTIGQTYEITDYNGGDDFDNVADVQEGTINTFGCVFIATGTTPSNWSNGSELTIV